MHIFISYAKADSLPLALYITELLKSLDNITVWMDEELTPGANFSHEITEQILKCDLMIVLISKDVNRPSPISFVLREVSLAQKKEKVIFPVLAESTEIPLMLEGEHYLDLTKGFEQGIQQLVNYVSKRADSPAPTSIPKPSWTLDNLFKAELSLTESPFILPFRNEISIGQSIRDMQFSDSGRWLLLGTQDGTIQLWDTTNWSWETKYRMPKSCGAVLSVTFLGNTGYIAAGSEHGAITLLDELLQNSIKELCTVESKLFVRSLVFSPKYNLLAAARSNHLHLWNMSNNNISEVFISKKGHTNDINSLSFSVNQNYVGSAASDKVIKIWRLFPLIDIQIFEFQEKHFGKFSAISFSSSDDNVFVCGAEKGHLYRGEVKAPTLTPLTSPHEAPITKIAFSADSKFFACGDSIGNISIWDNNFTLMTFFRAHLSKIWSLAFHPTDRFLASGSSNGSIRFWQVMQ